MNAGAIADLVINRLTAGGEICLDIQKTAVEKLIHDAFIEVCPWFDNPPFISTHPVVSVSDPLGGGGVGGYVDLSTLTPQVKYVQKLYTVRSRYYHVGDIVRDLLLLPAAPLETESIEEHAAWQMAWPQVKSLLGRELAYRFDEQKKILWVDDAQEGAVTLEYAPVLTDVCGVGNKRAMAWIINMAEARAKASVARVRGKFRSGPLNFETDAAEMLSEANEQISKLQDELKVLDFTFQAR